MRDTRKVYGGSSRALIIAFDVGTTFSGVSYALLEPGEVPKINGVTCFPGQEHVASNSKIPSVMYYNKHGRVMAAGAETDNASITIQAETGEWIKTELFKLRLRPKSMTLTMNGMRLSPLPQNKKSVDVFGDFLAYLFRCTKSFIIDTHTNGQTLWHHVESTIEFVLSHPNGWQGAEQTRMRRAAVYGGLIPDTDEGRARIRFVTEGEASLHACVQSCLAADAFSNSSRHGFLVADMGGGTLDICSYAVRGTNPLVIEEVAPPDCIFAGSVFVSHRAREFLEEKLKTSKRLFRDKTDLQFVPFGSPFDKDLSVGIHRGQLTIDGAQVAEFFEPSVQAAIAAIKAQVDASQGMIKSVWLVGGFAASPWLFSQLQERLAPMNISVSRPDNQTSKAVADGALSFYCDHHVSARMSKFTYGVEYLREYNPNDLEHQSRKGRLCELPSGSRLLPDGFDCILARCVKVKESTVFSRKYCTEVTNLSAPPVFEVEIWCYSGDAIPQWILRHEEDYSILCVVRADLSLLSRSAEPKRSKNGRTYWTIVFSVEIHFGLTEFKARIKWNDNGTIKYGPASIVYSESGYHADEDELDISEDDYARPHSESLSPSPSHSVAVPHESLASGIKTPLGAPRVEATSIENQDRSRTSVISAQLSASEVSTPSSPTLTATERGVGSNTTSISQLTAEQSTQEFKRQRTVSTASNVSTVVGSTVERGGRMSTVSVSAVSQYDHTASSQTTLIAASQPPSAALQPAPPVTGETRGRNAEPPAEDKGKGRNKTPSPPSLIDPPQHSVHEIPNTTILKYDLKSASNVSHHVHTASSQQTNSMHEIPAKDKGKGKNQTSSPPSPIDPPQSTVHEIPNTTTLKYDLTSASTVSHHVHTASSQQTFLAASLPLHSRIDPLQSSVHEIPDSSQQTLLATSQPPLAAVQSAPPSRIDSPRTKHERPASSLPTPPAVIQPTSPVTVETRRDTEPPAKEKGKGKNKTPNTTSPFQIDPPATTVHEIPVTAETRKQDAKSPAENKGKGKNKTAKTTSPSFQIDPPPTTIHEIPEGNDFEERFRGERG
ncbi:uncharacterized protein EDB93DRAFT_1255970 [Suillus bovinus]|uniref:uncharacterized protein n=1 Tax=Suillus bovinus TaxID=48563 RepID=UPI001B87FAEC|nr:uncharacterized protein EDB93DRAFT_1255970 [Suillus bovinus]KAG2130299.1 hypothetical protein EDB93DRAFT_1255970 [Suillus bovinus]